MIRILTTLALLLTATSASAWGFDHCKAELQLGYVSVHPNHTAHNLAVHCHQYLKADDHVPFGKHHKHTWEDTYPQYDGQWGTFILFNTNSWLKIANAENE